MTHPVKLLVVDDLQENLLMMQALLERPGVEPLLARSGDQALELLDQHEVIFAATKRAPSTSCSSRSTPAS